MIKAGVVLAQYGIGEGILAGDDSAQQRAKRTRRIHRAHKVYLEDWTLNEGWGPLANSQTKRDHADA